jgi:hypothetical protein
MRLERHKSFLSLNECAALNAWVDEAVKNKWLDKGVDPHSQENNVRVTSRFYGDRFVYPQLVLDVSERIRKFCGVADKSIIERHGRDGIVVSCTFTGGDVYPHRDPRSMIGLSALRCNVLTRAADSGGVLHLENQPIPLEVGELHCYLASEHVHYVSKVEGNTSRVLWMFGAYVLPYDWDLGKIKFGSEQ